MFNPVMAFWEINKQKCRTKHSLSKLKNKKQFISAAAFNSRFNGKC